MFHVKRDFERTTFRLGDNCLPLLNPWFHVERAFEGLGVSRETSIWSELNQWFHVERPFQTIDIRKGMFHVKRSMLNVQLSGGRHFSTPTRCPWFHVKRAFWGVPAKSDVPRETAICGA
jgi:hypothetical protein